MRRTRRVDRLRMPCGLREHVTPALCEAVVQRQRPTERTRTWTCYAVTRCWAALSVRHPPSIHAGLEQPRKRRSRDALWPRVLATPRACVKPAPGLRPPLFQATSAAFTRRLLPIARPAYAAWRGHVRQPCPEILIVEGSRLEAIRHRLQRRRPDRAPGLPGCLTVFDDLGRGLTRHGLCFPKAAEPELPRGQAILQALTPGTRRLGDRLSASLQHFHHLARCPREGRCRRHGRLTLTRRQGCSRQPGARTFLEAGLVEVGGGVGPPPLLLRRMRSRGPGRRVDLLTKVLEPTRLAPAEARALSRLRGSVERLVWALTETLARHGRYASQPHLVAPHVSAAAIVHPAFRVAPAGIARQARGRPEPLSPATLFPKLAQAAHDHGAVRV